MSNGRTKTSLELSDYVMEALKAEGVRGTSMTRTIESAVYWYFNRLDSVQRELARAESAEWLRLGGVPLDQGFLNALDAVLDEYAPQAKLVAKPVAKKRASGSKK